MICSVDWCNRPVYARGWCQRHYHRWHRFGDVLALEEKDTLSLIDRLFIRAMPEPNSGCWLWMEYTDRHGYGITHLTGQRQLAHRASWSAANGPIPDGLDVLHSCDQRCCINPDHLRVGTDLDNSRDMIARGRGRWPGQRGENHPRAKLTADDVRLIRSDPRPDLEQLSARFGVSRSTIRHVVSGYSWRQVE